MLAEKVIEVTGGDLYHIRLSGIGSASVRNPFTNLLKRFFFPSFS